MICKNMLGKRLVPYIQLNYPDNQVTFNRQPNNWADTVKKLEKAKKWWINLIYVIVDIW